MTEQRAQEILELVRRNYQEIAADFAATRQKALWPEIKRRADQVPAGARVLDAGCGSGRLAAAFAGRNIEYVGVDNSPALLNFAKKNYPEAKFTFGDVLNLETLSESGFNYIFCLAVLQHIPGQALRSAALRQLAAKLAPEGQLIISVWNIRSQPRFRRLLFKAGWSKLWGSNDLDYGDLIFPWKNTAGQALSQRYYHAFKFSELRRLAQGSGLRTLELFRDRYNYWLILENNKQT